MYSVYVEELQIDINYADFVSVRTDETADIICESLFVIVFSFV